MTDFEYIAKGYCKYAPGKSLKEQTGNIPCKYGVYLFHRNSKDGEILYIGKSGTITVEGTFGEQSLKKRINNKKSKNLKREDWLIEQFNNDSSLKRIYIEWLVIDEKQYLPGYVEACLIQQFYNQYKRLPLWNNRF